jgi:heterodisulfide reductase subunit A
MSRIGVFVCHCGLNIAKTIRVSELAQFAATLPDVVVAKDYKFMCSTPGQEMIANDIKEHKLDRVIVAACSPLMHEQTFRKVIENAGLNKYLVTIVNILTILKKELLKPKPCSTAPFTAQDFLLPLLLA